VCVCVHMAQLHTQSCEHAQLLTVAQSVAVASIPPVSSSLVMPSSQDTYACGLKVSGVGVYRV
jgi:hypothetical protein